jgi:hypothetical protein
MKTKEEFIKAELNTQLLTPIQWEGIMRAMENYKQAETKQLKLNVVGVRSEQLVNCLKEWESVDSKEDIDALREWVSKRPRLTN